MRRIMIAAALLAAVPLARGQQQGGAIGQRNQSLSEVVLQLQQLQREVQQLRGELEMQGHAIDAMNKRQRELYLDIDNRLNQAGAGTQPQPPAQPPAVAAPVEERTAPQPPAAPVRTGVPAVAPGDPAHEQASYQKAFELLREGSYAESITAFRGFLDRYPGGDYADNAQYWLGEASYVTRDFDTALRDFNAVLTAYPDSSKVPDAMLKIGYIHYEQRRWGEAKKTLKQLREQHPSSTPARLAEKRLERMRKEGH